MTESYLNWRRGLRAFDMTKRLQSLIRHLAHSSGYGSRSTANHTKVSADDGMPSQTMATLSGWL